MSAYGTYKPPKGSLASRLHLVDDLGLTGFGLLVGLTVGVVAILAVIFASVTYGGRAYGRTTCTNWGAQTGVKTKFVILNWADSGTCLAKTPDGRWVLNSRWQAFVNASKR